MWQKIFFLVTLFTALIIFGCSDETVAPPSDQSSAFTGETQFIEYVNPGTLNKLVDGKTHTLNQVAIFRDISDNPQLNGLRNVVVTSNSQGNSYGTFSLETNDVRWEGNWTGTTTSSGTTIKATGYDLNERGKTCEWYYDLPSSQDRKAGTFSARIMYERD